MAEFERDAAEPEGYLAEHVDRETLRRAFSTLVGGVGVVPAAGAGG